MWATDLKDWQQLIKEEAFKIAGLVQDISANNQSHLKTTRCPIRFDGELLTSDVPAPELGKDNQQLEEEFNL